VNGQDSQTEIFDVFLCHNSEDKPFVREIAQKLSQENIKPWLDEADIKAGSFWHTTIGKQIETVKSAAVFVGQHGVGPWQQREMIALLDEFDRRGCPVIPVILESAPVQITLPWSLKGLHCVDFRATDTHPLKRLIWGITDQKPAEFSNVPDSEKPATMREAAKIQLLPSGDEHAATPKVRSGDSRLYPPLTQPPDPEQATQLEILRRRVKEYWVDGVLRHSLYNEVLISLGFHLTDEFVDAPWKKYTVEVSDAVDSGPLVDRHVSAIYDATGLLLILGEPGSGKTTTLLDLARALLQRAQDDIKERVPVVLNLSSWKKEQGLVEWISGELSEKYRVPRKIAHFWLKNNYLLPLLDGLDEVGTTLQPDCVTAINAFIEEFNPSGLVVCCRLNEYRWLPERLKLNGAICLEPLSKDEVAEYFRRSGAELATLRKAVNKDPVLQELTQTPLMLSVMSLAFQGAGADELAGQGDSPEERRKQIFRLYVEKMLQRKGTPSLAFPKEKVIGWLSWLAGKMREHSESVFLVEGLQPSWLGARAQRVAYKAVVALSFGLGFGLFLGLNSGPLFGLTGGLSILVGVGLGCCSESLLKNAVTSGSIGGLIFGLIAALNTSGLLWQLYVGLSNGLFIGLICGLGAGSLNHITLVETMSWKWNQFWKRTITGLIGGLSVGLLFGLSVGLLFVLGGITPISELQGLKGLQFGLEALQFGLQYGLIFASIGGLCIGLVGGFIGRVKVSKAFPNQGIKLSRKNALTAFLVSWPISGLIVSLYEVLNVGRPSEVLDVGVWFRGLIFGLIFGLSQGGSAVIKHYALRLIFWRNGCMLLNFVKFLDHCAKLILLKKVGGGYIFIHRMLLEYFADLPAIERSGESKRT
jgi:hypothetical protein